MKTQTKKLDIVKLDIVNEINQWVEIYSNGIFLKRMLVGTNQNDKEIIDEYYNQLNVDKYLCI